MLEDIKGKAQQFMARPDVQQAAAKAKEFIESEKGEELLNQAKEKAEEIVRDKTNGKGILGFGKKQ